jgi:Flp pilus assembly protein CpaB
MGRLRRTVPRSRVPWRRRALLDPAAVRYWLLVAAVSCVVAAVVGHAVNRAEHAQRDWGRTKPVLVAAEPIERGDDLAGATRSEAWPVGLVPDAALKEVLPGARAASRLDPGAPITRASLLDGADPADPDARTVAVPADQHRLPVHEGDRVDAWATADPSLVADGEPLTRRVASGARVVAVTPETVVLAVAPGAVPDLAEAATTATITLVGTA